MPGALLTPQAQSILAERIRSHQPAAEEELVRLFADRVSVLALARTRDRELARDLTQDVMLAVVLALRNGHLREAERLAAFVYGTARNVINNYLRTRSRAPRIDPLDVEVEAATTPDPVEESERADLVRRALAILDATDRQILRLTLTEGLKPGEIAARLGLTSEVIRTRKSRALKKTVERMKRLSRR
jgi:RNA polymerase sigma factor (sigma-70 family)